MPSYPIRRAQLITTFGPGAMMVSRDGISMICCGLDHWYQREPGRQGDAIDVTEYRVEEWRLQAALGVSHFRLPPDHRSVRRGEDAPPNCQVTVPFLRFPQWHYCTWCSYLTDLPLEARGMVHCPQCERKDKKEELVQVRFVAICDRGHIQDFPWREWVHRSAHPTCQGTLRLIARGGTTLASQVVRCDGCKKERTLGGITIGERSSDAAQDSTRLTSQLEAGVEFTCQGKRPWLGTTESTPCDRPLYGALRSAANVWYPQVRSAIYLPTGEDPAVEQARDLLANPPFSTVLLWADPGTVDVAKLRKIADQHARHSGPELLRGFTDAQLGAALKALNQGGTEADDAAPRPSDDAETAFRRAEHQRLRTSRDQAELRVRPVELKRYDADVAKYFSRITLVEKLRETRVLAGLGRVLAENSQSLSDRKALLWSDLSANGNSWLPAYVVRGEGFYLELNETELASWLKRQEDAITTRTVDLIARAAQIRLDRRLEPRPISPRFILLHTLAHLLINQLVFECGYSAASLSERLYVSEDPEAPMAGLLIYTAAGDSEGTLGGLVRMAEPGELERVLRQALGGAKWCSADPVCMEMGRFGQGPLSTNLAACHSCCLLPETACEEFNRFLDRGLVIGEIANPSLAFFDL